MPPAYKDLPQKNLKITNYVFMNKIVDGLIKFDSCKAQLL